MTTIALMKTLSALSLSAALAAFLFVSAGFMAAVSLLFAVGFAAIVATDYMRQPRPLRMVPAAVVPARKERFGLAA